MLIKLNIFQIMYLIIGVYNTKTEPKFYGSSKISIVLGMLLRFGDLCFACTSAIQILECVQIIIKFDTCIKCIAKNKFEAYSFARGYHVRYTRTIGYLLLENCEWE